MTPVSSLLGVIGPGEGTAEVRAPAKINLSLRILARESSGYHQLETIFCAIELHDEIRIEPASDGLHLEVEGAELGKVHDNLVYRAAHAFHEAAGRPAAARIRLRKRIPAGAGLGGGSSDAAATLAALNAIHGEPLDRVRLLEIAAALGSDVPFFLSESPLALAWGRGERMLPLPALPTVPALVVVPPFAISTPDAYRELAEHRERSPVAARPAIIEPDSLREWSTLAALAANDFEEPTFRRYPELEGILDALNHGAMIARLSGSGSALFGLFPDLDRRAEAAERVARIAPRARLIQTRTAPSIG